jgi:hypothetical protein
MIRKASEEETLKKRVRRRFHNHLTKKLMSNKDDWLSFWGDKAQISLHSKEVQDQLNFDIEGVKEHFLFFLYHVDMLTSIIVKPNQMISIAPEGTPKDNSQYLKIAIENFTKIVQDLGILKITKNGKKRFIRRRMFERLWETLQKWTTYSTTDPEISSSLSVISAMLFHGNTSKKFPRCFFDFVFCNSFLQMNQRVSIYCNQKQNLLI